jgi:hypothetical protein
MINVYKPAIFAFGLYSIGITCSHAHQMTVTKPDYLLVTSFLE